MNTLIEEAINKFEEKYNYLDGNGIYSKNGCTLSDLNNLKSFVKEQLRLVATKSAKEARDIELKKTLVAIPKGYKYIEVTSLGKIIVEPIKDIKNGATLKTIYFEEALSNSKE